MRPDLREGRLLLRQIGDLPQNLDRKVFEDHLLGLGIKSRFDRGPDGWAVWIYNEDHVDRARRELDDYLNRPDDARFLESAPAAAEARRREKALDRQFRRNDRDVAAAWSGPTFRRRPLTMLLVGFTIAVYVLQQGPGGVFDIEDWLGFYSWRAGDPAFRPHQGLTDVLDGQVWRLVTPIFLHFKVLGKPILHVLFNMMWLLALGTQIELARGTRRLLILILVSAALSNLAEYFYAAELLNRYPFFGGFSGVVYALFGYVWMKSEYEPEQGLGIDSRNLVLMLGWLVLCMTGALGPVANAAHLGGLAVGMGFGILRF
jgi:GlpG protein